MSFLSVLFHHKKRLIPFLVCYGNYMSIEEMRQKRGVGAVPPGDLGVRRGDALCLQSRPSLSLILFPHGKEV